MPGIPCPSAEILSALQWQTAVGGLELPASNHNSALGTCLIQIIKDSTDVQGRELFLSKNNKENKGLTTKMLSHKVSRMKDHIKNGGRKNVNFVYACAL